MCNKTFSFISVFSQRTVSYTHFIGIFLVVLLGACGGTKPDSDHQINGPSSENKHPQGETTEKDQCEPICLNKTEKDQCEPIRLNNTSAENKHHLIVVSTTTGLNNYGKTIQQTLFDVLKPYLGQSLPATLLTVRPECVTAPLSDWSRISNETALWKKITGNIRFGFSSDALANLKLIQDEYPQKFQRVLYLTDNGSMGEDELDPNAFEVPKSWSNNGIQLTVLTVDSCAPWKNEAQVANCQKLDDGADFDRALRDFLN